MTRRDLLKVIDRFRQARILVVGDLILDKYMWGRVARISPEAPVQVVALQGESYVAGGAANVANNISGLAGEASLAGYLGEDDAKDKLLGLLKEGNIDTSSLVTTRQRNTTAKVRILGHSQQLLRVDTDSDGPISNTERTALQRLVSRTGKNVDAIIVSDYAKGVLSKSLMTLIRNTNRTVIVDPKPSHTGWYKGVSVITPNLKEAKEMALMRNGNAHAYARRLSTKLDSEVIITMGAEGLLLLQRNRGPISVPAEAKQVYDVTGAGDTFVAVLSLALAVGASIPVASILANRAAGIVVGKVGTNRVEIDEFRDSVSTMR